MSVGIIILNYNDYKTTKKLVENIRDYSNITNIVVVDNNSTDNSYEDLLQLEDHKVDIIKTEKNGGYAYGNNVGIRYCINKYNPKYIIIANPDIHFEENIIDEMIKLLIKYKDEKIGIVAPKMKYSDGRDSLVACKLPTLIDNISYLFISYNKIFGNRIEYKKYEHIDINNLIVDVLPGSFFMISKDAIQAVNYFDEDTFLYCEEMILSHKLINLGYKNILMNNYEYIHDHSVSIDKSFKSLSKKYKILINSMKIYNKKYLKLNRSKLIIFQMSSYLALSEKYLINILLKLRGK